jgi:long-chain acyl-CoA synthetase
MPNISFHTVYQTFEAVAERRGDHTAVIYLGTRYSYRTVREMACQFAAALLDLGVTPGGRVMIYLPNSIQWIISWLGIQRTGAVCVPITPIYTPSDLSYIARDSECTTIICADTNFGYVKRVLTETGIKQVIVARMADLLPWWKRGFGHLFDIIPKGKTATGKDVFPIKQLLNKHIHSTLPDISPDGQALAEILYTGGTTRHPKGVPLSHDLFLTSALEQIRTSEPLIPVEENVILGNAPLFHILGQTCSLATLLVGGALLFLT